MQHFFLAMQVACVRLFSYYSKSKVTFFQEMDLVTVKEFMLRPIISRDFPLASQDGVVAYLLE
jgi:hypothetical protein